MMKASNSVARYAKLNSTFFIVKTKMEQNTETFSEAIYGDRFTKVKSVNSVLRFVHANRSCFLSELDDFVQFHSISAQSKYTKDVVSYANWLAIHMKQIGLRNVDVLSTPHHPIVYAESKQPPHRPTILIYGHYDVQPPDPLKEWHSPPFQSLVCGENLYGRSACDDKGQMFAHIKAIETYLQTQPSLPVNVKCLFEGEEEIGGPNLLGFLASNCLRLLTGLKLQFGIYRSLDPSRRHGNFSRLSRVRWMLWWFER